jgi:hypothetical protein
VVFDVPPRIRSYTQAEVAGVLWWANITGSFTPFIWLREADGVFLRRITWSGDVEPHDPEHPAHAAVARVAAWRDLAPTPE